MAHDHFRKHPQPHPNTQWWSFNLTFTNQIDVTRMAQEYAQVIHHPGLYDPIPPEWLHSTILHIGTTDDYSEAEMRDVTELVAENIKDISLPEMVFDSWWLWGGNVCLHITPSDKLSSIYKQVALALRTVVGDDRAVTTPHGHFIAHTTLAYTKTHDQERAIHDALVLHPIRPASFRATHISLVKQMPRNGHYEWEVVRNIGLKQN